MRVIGLSDQEQSSVFRLISALLWLGNVVFQDARQRQSAIIASLPGTVYYPVCYLW